MRERDMYKRLVLSNISRKRINLSIGKQTKQSYAKSVIIWNYTDLDDQVRKDRITTRTSFRELRSFSNVVTYRDRITFQSKISMRQVESKHGVQK